MNSMGLGYRICSILRLTAILDKSSFRALYPVAIVVSQGEGVRYGFLSDGFKNLGSFRNYPRKGDKLPFGATRTFNSDPENVLKAKRLCEETSFSEWFDGDKAIPLDEEIVGLGSYGFTLTVFSSDELPEDPDYEDEDEEDSLIDSWTPKFARGR